MPHIILRSTCELIRILCYKQTEKHIYKDLAISGKTLFKIKGGRDQDLFFCQILCGTEGFESILCYAAHTLLTAKTHQETQLSAI